jgi:hypothetical protein
MVDEYEVKKLLAKRRDHKGRSEFLVRWSGQYSDPKFDSWVGWALLRVACAVSSV